eukprot:266841_1
MTNCFTMKSAILLILLSIIQLNKSVAPGCGNIPYCKSYNPDPCNTCSCSDPINNPKLAMCTLAYCPDPTFTPECTLCMDGYTLLNKQCTQLSPIEPIPPALPPQISKISPLPTTTTPCHMCPGNYAPVCCSDGKTYSNQCAASCNGLTACTTGKCITISEPIGCEYLPACQDQCVQYYAYPYYRFPTVQCQGYPNAQCQTKATCSGCYKIWTDEYGNEIKCIPPPIEPMTCNTDANCRNWQNFYCRHDIKCRMSSTID